MEFVLDAEVRKVHRVIEVPEVMVACPVFDLARGTIGSSVTVRPAAVSFLEPFLVLALELVLEDDAADVGALFAKPFLFAQVGAIELDVVRQLARPAYAGVEGLLARIVTVAAVGFQEVMAAFRQRDRALATVQ